MTAKGDAKPGEPSDALHCLCGRLVARWVEGQIELRCQRCKRTLRLVTRPDGTIEVRELHTP